MVMATVVTTPKLGTEAHLDSYRHDQFFNLQPPRPPSRVRAGSGKFPLSRDVSLRSQSFDHPQTTRARNQ